MKAFTSNGVWWLPGHRREMRATGTLRFDPAEGAWLDIVGRLDPEYPLAQLVEREYESVVGELTDGTPITLETVRASHHRIPLGGGTESSTYRVTRLIRGAHIWTDDRCEAITVRLTNLDDWIQVSGITIGDAENRKRVVFTDAGEVCELQSVAGVARLKLTVDATKSPLSDRELSIREGIEIEALPNVPADFRSVYSALVWPIQEFLTFASRGPVRIIDVSARFTEKAPIVEVFDRRLVTASQANQLAGVSYWTVPPVSNMGEARQWLNEWLGVRDRFESARHRLITARTQPAPYLEERFLAMAHASEQFHREGPFQQKMVDPADYDLMVERIKKVVTDENPEREWFAQKLEHLNEVALATRIRDLASFAGLAGDLGGGKFVRLVADTRHYLTHRDPRGRSRAASGIDLHWLTRKLSFLVDGAWLKAMGRDPASLFAENEDFRVLREIPLRS